MTGRPSTKILRAGLFLSLFDVALVVMTGGVSLLGSVGGWGFAVRIAVALGLLLANGRRDAGRARLFAYTALFLLLLPVLHYRGYRLRGDGLWYYSFAHSLAFDADIDLGNQYERLGIDGARGSQPVRETGRPRYTFPVGAPVVWVPFIWLGHVSVWVANLYGVEHAYDGFADPYLHTVSFFNALLGWLGLLVLDRLSRRWFSKDAAFLATASAGLGTFLGFYLTYHAIYTHALTFLLMALFVERWVAGERSTRALAISGLVLGAAACVRWQNAVFGLLFVAVFVDRLRDKAWAPVAAFGVGAAAPVLAQIASWKIIFDQFYIGVPLGVGYMRWSDPFVTETLFSSRHGLFSWSPLLLLAVLGLPGFVRRAPRVGWPLVGMLLFLTYVNSSVSDWWAGGSFGSRRFDSVLPILALGLASWMEWTLSFVRRRPVVVVSAAVVACIAANFLLMEQVRKGRIPPDDTISWQAAAEGGLEDAFDAVGYPFSFPMNWMFAARYDRPKTQYDILVGKYLFHSMGNLGGVIDLGVTDPPFIGNGWSGVKDWPGRPRGVRHALGSRAGIFVPTDRAEPLRIFVECAVPEGGRAVPIAAWVNGERIGGFFPTHELTEHVLTTDAEHWQRINLVELAPADAVDGDAYLVVDKIRFERLDR